MMNDTRISSTAATPLRGRSCFPVIALSSLDGPLIGLGATSLHLRRDADQQPHAVAAGVVARVLAADVPGRAGDVDVGPGGVADELLEEGGGGDGSRLALRAQV